MTTVRDYIKALEKLPQDKVLVIGAKDDKFGRRDEYDFTIETRDYGFSGDDKDIYYALCPDGELSCGAIRRR